MIKKVAVLTSGGDAPGMNAAVRATIRAGLFQGYEMYVVYNGFRGLYEGDIHQVNKDFTQDIINRGGTILKSSRFPEFKEEEIVEMAATRLRDYDIDALVGIGGDGTFRGLQSLAKAGVNVIGIPASIDNDVASTDYTIGFMTALNTICECVDKIKDTSSSHQKCSVIEVMGRHCPDLALFSSVAEAAELVIAADKPYKEEEVMKTLRKMKAQKKSHAIVIVSEHMLDVRELAEKIEKQTGFDTNVEVLGHLQRGGAPCAFDRILASLLCSYGIQCLKEGQKDVIINFVNEDVVALDVDEALAMKRQSRNDLLKMIAMLQ